MPLINATLDIIKSGIETINKGMNSPIPSERNITKEANIKADKVSNIMLKANMPFFCLFIISILLDTPLLQNNRKQIQIR